jgi:lysophospholipase L1-like esterase
VLTTPPPPCTDAKSKTVSSRRAVSVGLANVVVWTVIAGLAGYASPASAATDGSPPAVVDPAPTDPAPTDPAPTDPAPTDPAPTVEPTPTDPAPTDPAPTVEPTPTDPAPAHAALRIMPLGDSITYGIGSQTLSSYRVDLQQRLAGLGMNVDFVGSRPSGTGEDVDNEGHGGWTIGQIAERATGWLNTYQPDAVLLQIGTNDIIHRLDLPKAPSRLSALIDQIHAARPTAHIFVAKITSSKAVGYQSGIDAYNARIPQIVAAKGALVHLVNQTSVAGIDLRDSVHPNDFGYAKMAYNWYRGMEKVYNTSGTAWPEGANPYKATNAYRCLLANTTTDGAETNTVDCRWWYLRQVTSIVNGKSVSRMVWQTQRLVTESYQATDVPAHDKYVTKRVKINGRYVTSKVRIHVAATYITKTRRVTKWVNT